MPWTQEGTVAFFGDDPPPLFPMPLGSIYQILLLTPSATRIYPFASTHVLSLSRYCCRTPDTICSARMASGRPI